MLGDLGNGVSAGSVRWPHVAAHPEIVRPRSARRWVASAKWVTGIDDHSRYAVIATVLAVPNGRAVFHHSDEPARQLLNDDGMPFTGGFTKPRPADVLFERICWENDITAHLTKPRTPITTGKIERWHSTGPGLLDHCGPFADLPAAQTAIDAWVHTYDPESASGADMATPPPVSPQPKRGRHPICDDLNQPDSSREGRPAAGTKQGTARDDVSNSTALALTGTSVIESDVDVTEFPAQRSLARRKPRSVERKFRPVSVRSSAPPVTRLRPTIGVHHA